MIGDRKGGPLGRVWEERAKRLLKGELKRRGITYAQLSRLLAENQIHETERNLANKISRGGFTAAFFLQCLDAIQVEELSLRTVSVDSNSLGQYGGVNSTGK